jgi:hypothetical protein
MKEIPLTKGQTALVDDIDFQRLPPGKWHSSNGYAAKRIAGPTTKGRLILLHRFVMDVLDDPTFQVDHINGVRTDCRRENLRKCTHTENCQNSAKKRNNKYKCVSWDKDKLKFETYIGIGGKKKHLGYFDDEEAAARHYNFKARELYGDFARYNNVMPMFPEADLSKVVIYRNNTSGFRGVVKDGIRWKAQIQRGAKGIFLGKFTCPIEAAKAYDAKAKELHGIRAKLNFK